MIYRVRYSSMTAGYGPSFIEADSPYEAKRKFAKGAFSAGEMTLITAIPVSSSEIADALNQAEKS